MSTHYVVCGCDKVVMVIPVDDGKSEKRYWLCLCAECTIKDKIKDYAKTTRWGDLRPPPMPVHAPASGKHTSQDVVDITDYKGKTTKRRDSSAGRNANRRSS